ncbi:MAG: carbohydrate porin [Planctomycetota bacterium]
MMLMLKKCRISETCIILLILLFFCCFESEAAEDNAEVSKPKKESKKASETPSDSNDIPASSGEGLDVSEQLEESKRVVEAIKDSNEVAEPNKVTKAAARPVDINDLPVDVNDIIKDSNDVSTDSHDVSEKLEESKQVLIRQLLESEIVLRVFRPYLQAKKYLHDKYRFDVAQEQVLIYQRATGGRRPREQATYNFTFFGQWHISEDPKKDLGIMGFSFEERDNITNHSARTFSEEVGANFNTHGLNSNERSRTALRQLWWRKKFAEDKMALTIGKIHDPSYYNRNAFAGNPRTSFLSNPFSRNPNRLTPADGLGLNINLKPNDKYYISAGISDAEADNTSSGFSTIGDGHLFTALELGLTPTIKKAGRGNYRFTLWHTNQADDEETIATENDGYGFALSFDQELNKSLGLFARYGYTSDEVTTIENFVSGGFVIRNPFNIDGNLFGVGVSWDENSTTKKDEYALEVFYRVQATRLMQITPSILIVFDPAQSDKTEPVAVFGIRARTLF